MTIGGWCLGNAYFAWKTARVWRWGAVYPNFVYLWSFGILQTFVLVLFRDKVLVSGFAAWIYFVALGANLLCAALGIIEWYRRRPKIKPEGKTVANWVRIIVISDITFAILVTILMLLHPQPIINGDIMPEKTTLFTIYAFAMFYLSLSLAGLAAVKSKTSAPIYYLGQGAIAFMIPTTTAAILFFAKVNFREEVGAFLYIFIYILILLAAVVVVKSFANKKTTT
jgi:hypothetical protein